MWVAKLVYSYKPSDLLGSRTRKFGVTLTGYPVSSAVLNGRLHVTLAGIISGPEHGKRRFLRDVAKDSRVVRMHVNGDFMVNVVKHPLRIMPLYSPEIIHAKPVVVNEKGEYILELASCDKRTLLRVVDGFRGDNARLQWCVQKKLSNIGITYLMPELTAKQRRAVELAIARGYYDVPRKVKLVELATELGLSYSTFQFHLQVAEKKLMPALFKRI
ncbi:helix-turn-helix domain-containing protein [Candidatus Woesearchaeota archaeon]|nr:helix-turn-helix domain-containing protein [Candidatus Woesearchaeota archaeon]